MLKQVAWGYVTRDIGNGKELLIATRCKKDDPLRSGELVIPGGRLEENESYLDAAIREVYQETGIITKFSQDQLFIGMEPRQFKKDKIFGKIGKGEILMTYFDSGKNYCGMLVCLDPLDTYKEPKQRKSDAKKPEYISFGEVKERKKEFTPACQVLLEIAGF